MLLPALLAALPLWVWLRHSALSSRSFDRPARGEDNRIDGAPGPWGQLSYVGVDIEPPPDLLASAVFHLPQWFFGGQSREQVVTFLGDAGLPRTDLDTLQREGQWTASPLGVTVAPLARIVLSMPVAVRDKVYSALARFPQNPEQRDPIPLLQADLERRLRTAGLDHQTVALLKGVLYPRGRWWMLSDYSTLMQSSEPTVRRKLAATIMRTGTFVVRIEVNADTDVEALVRYWNHDGRAIDLRPLLRSLTAVPGGTTLNLVYMLPPLARTHLYVYPHPDDAVESKADCFWTSLNFFRETPDSHAEDPTYVFKTLGSRYAPIRDAPRFGDIAVLLDSRGNPVHVAVYIADDLLYTKNGRAMGHPWILAKRDELVDVYSALAGPLKLVYVRHIPPGTGDPVDR